MKKPSGKPVFYENDLGIPKKKALHLIYLSARALYNGNNHQYDRITKIAHKMGFYIIQALVDKKTVQPYQQTPTDRSFSDGRGNLH